MLSGGGQGRPQELGAARGISLDVIDHHQGAPRGMPGFRASPGPANLGRTQRAGVHPVIGLPGDWIAMNDVLPGGPDGAAQNPATPTR